MVPVNFGRVLAVFAAATLLPATPVPAQAAKCTLARVAEWPVRSGTGPLIVEGKINGQPVGVMLDTGAVTLLLRSGAERLGLVRYDVRGARVVAIGGETGAQAVTVDEFAVGAIVQKNVRLMVAGEHPLGDVDVILGEDFFKQFEVEFDLPHDAIRLFKATGCEGSALAYWAPGGAPEVDLDIGASVAPQVEVRVEINGRPFIAQFDSGAHRSVLARSAAQSLGVTSSSPGVVAGGCFGGGGEKPIATWIGPFESFRIGEEKIRDPKLYFADVWRYSTYAETRSHARRPVDHADMLLGADFLRSHRVLVAHSQRKMYFEYVSGTVFPTTPTPLCENAAR